MGHSARWTAVGLGTGALAVSAGIFSTGIASAQDTPDGNQGRRREAFCSGEHDARRQERRTEFTADLASELGLDPAAVEQAILTVFIDNVGERVDGAVANGRLTQAEADELLAAAQSGTLGDLRRQRVCTD